MLAAGFLAQIRLTDKPACCMCVWQPLPAAGKSTSRESDNSLVSMDNSENEEVISGASDEALLVFQVHALKVKMPHENDIWGRYHGGR